MKILIVKISALGDIIHSLPVAMAIRAQVPGARIDWVVEAPSFNLLEGHPALGKVFLSPRHIFKKSWRAGINTLPGFIGELRQEYYDAVLDLQGLMKSSIFVLLCRARRKIGFAGGKEPLSRLPLSEPLPPYDIERHALDRYLDLLAPLGLARPQKVEYGLAPKPELVTSWAEKLKGQGPLVLLHPVAKWDTKLWPEEHWAKLIDGLTAQGVRVVLSGAPEDKAVNQRIIAMLLTQTNVYDLSGQTSLQELMAVLTLAGAVVSTDTGVMHLAAALNRPLVALFGPTAANRTGPYGAGHVVLSAPLNCRPCFRRQCPNHICMPNINPLEVLDATMLKLNTSKPQGCW